MAVPTLITDLSTTPASNSPAGSENVFPNLDDYLRAQSAFLASVRDNSGNGWVSPYLPLAGGTMTGTVNGLQMASANGGQLAGLRNRIINGDMRIDQRNAGAAVTPAASTYTLDRWQLSITQASKLTVRQNLNSIAPPAGFGYQLGISTAVAVSSLAAGDYFIIQQPIEGYNVQDFAFGSASAADITLSFWVRSSLTGTFSGGLGNNALNRSYVFTYSIPTANTWTKISVTIAGDTGGTWTVNNTIGLNVRFSLGMGSTYSSTAGSWQTGSYYAATGSVSVVGTLSATFYITGVQVEIGSIATPFEQIPFSLSVQFCQRYYWTQTTAQYAAYLVQNDSIFWTSPYSVTMRIAPSITSTGGTASPATTTIGFVPTAFGYVTNLASGASGTTPTPGRHYVQNTTLFANAEL